MTEIKHHYGVMIPCPPSVKEEISQELLTELAPNVFAVDPRCMVMLVTGEFNEEEAITGWNKLANKEKSSENQ